MARCVSSIMPWLLMVLSISGCSGDVKGPTPPLRELSAEYSLEQAKEDGCVVYEDGDITQGEDAFELFISKAEAGGKSTVRLVFYDTLGDPSGYDSEYYESIKEEYPILTVQDLAFDGTSYWIKWYEHNEEVSAGYRYMMRYAGEAETPYATYQSYIRYVLTNDDSVTWQDIQKGMVSSKLGDAIPHKVVYVNLID